jgi:hypothetical protein
MPRLDRTTLASIFVQEVSKTLQVCVRIDTPIDEQKSMGQEYYFADVSPSIESKLHPARQNLEGRFEFLRISLAIELGPQRSQFIGIHVPTVPKVKRSRLAAYLLGHVKPMAVI